MLVRGINCGFPCQKYGKTLAGTQRWFCTACHISFVNKIDNTTKQLKEFLTWLFSKTTQQELPAKVEPLEEIPQSFGIFGLCRLKWKNEKILCL